MKIYEAKQLCHQYGSNTTLGDLVRIIQGNKVHMCPKCSGKGYTVVEYNSYPDGLPDSGWEYRAAYKNIPCDLCDGAGYTSHKYKPRMVQDGWE